MVLPTPINLMTPTACSEPDTQVIPDLTKSSPGVSSPLQGSYKNQLEVYHLSVNI